MLRYLLALIVIYRMMKVWAAHVKRGERHVGSLSAEDGLYDRNGARRTSETGSLGRSAKG